jgi:hypothetical protein
MLTMLRKYQDIFATDEFDIGKTRTIKHAINTGNAIPIKQRAYRLSFEQNKEVEKNLEKMEKMGVLRKSNSPWASPVVLARKGDGSYRFCVDYRALNKSKTHFRYQELRISSTH